MTLDEIAVGEKVRIPAGATGRPIECAEGMQEFSTRDSIGIVERIDDNDVYVRVAVGLDERTIVYNKGYLRRET